MAYKNRILIVNTFTGEGGGETYIVNLYNTLLKSRQPVYFLSVNGAPVNKTLAQLQLPFDTCSPFKISFNDSMFQPFLTAAIYKLCKKHTISIVHCTDKKNIVAAKKVAQWLPIKVVYTHVHMPHPIPYQQELDGITCLSPDIAAYYNKENKNVAKPITYIPPFFDEDRFVNFGTTQSRQDFFKEAFGITIKNCPVICTIANFNKDRAHKNHPLLFKAVRTLIHEKNTPVQVALAGNGPREAEYKQLVKELGIQDYVHFLGNIAQTAELLFHSDIKVLPSSYEAFGIVLLEAALMKKPIIIATKTCAADVFIHDNQTGLLFENNNGDSLAEKIELLVNNPDLGKKLGENAYVLAKQEFGNSANLAKLNDFYGKVMG